MNLDQLKSEYVGKELTSKLEKKIRKAHPNIRIQKHGYLYTLEYSRFRTNLIVDEKNIIINVTNG